VKAGIVLKLPNQKALGFYVLIVLIRWFFEHARKIFSEMPVRS
jgi:hypothetical protein